MAGGKRVRFEIGSNVNISRLFLISSIDKLILGGRTFNPLKFGEKSGFLGRFFEIDAEGMESQFHILCLIKFPRWQVNPELFQLSQ
jgi:hypothetical protein